LAGADGESGEEDRWAFGCFKPAVVLEGIRARFLERKGGPVVIERAYWMLGADG
jgi:hypothetical protein